MKSIKSSRFLVCSVIIIFAATFILFQAISHAETKLKKPAGQMQIQKNDPATLKPALKLCADLSVGLRVSKTSSGLVTLHGTISNVGSGDYNIPSEVQVFMNLSYPPKTYNQIGVSEQICTKAFALVKKGASFPVTCSFQIPDFQAWASGATKEDAKRLFSMRAVKKDMSSYKAGEDCNANNNSKSVEVKYLKK